MIGFHKDSEPKPRRLTNIREKSAVFVQSGPFSTENGGASRFLLRNVTKSNQLLAETQNYNIMKRFLKFHPLGQELGPFLRYSGPKLPRKWGNFQKGGKFCFPTKISTCIQCEI